MKPLVSIIITCFNSEKYLHLAIQSILSQTYENLEILLCDDGSTDSTTAIIESIEDNRVKKFYNSFNLGYLETCNRLLLEANGVYIGFQDSDDTSVSSRIEEQIDFLEGHMSVAMCGTNFFRKNEGGKVISKSNFPNNSDEINEYISINRNLPFCGASVIIRTAIIKEIGVYRTFYNRIGFEHFDWFLLILEKYNGVNLKGCLYEYRFVPNSFSRENIFLDYRKYYIRDIAFFLADQRRKYGFDGLQRDCLKNDFEQYLLEMKLRFETEQEEIGILLLERAVFNTDSMLFRKVLQHRKTEGVSLKFLFKAKCLELKLVLKRLLIPS
jgi:glycosyltransferase involved in cell wall biosynthesis